MMSRDSVLRSFDSSVSELPDAAVAALQKDPGSASTGLRLGFIKRTPVESFQADSNEFTPLYFIPLLSFPVFLRTSQKKKSEFISARVSFDLAVIPIGARRHVRIL